MASGGEDNDDDDDEDDDDDSLSLDPSSVPTVDSTIPGSDQGSPSPLCNNMVAPRLDENRNQHPEVSQSGQSVSPESAENCSLPPLEAPISAIPVQGSPSAPPTGGLSSTLLLAT